MIESQLNAAELRALGTRLLTLAEQLEQAGDGAGAPARPSPAVLAQTAARIWSERQQREEYLPSELFAEPGWDMLLDLFVMRVNRRLASVKSICLASNTPMGTALRWVSILEEMGLVVSEDSLDGERVRHVRLSDRGYERMCAMLESYFVPNG